MRNPFARVSFTVIAAVVLVPSALAEIPNIAPGSAYIQTNLASDLNGVAQLVDPQLINPWGITYRGTSPFWTANNASSTSSLLAVDPVTDATTLNVPQSHVNIPGGFPTGVVGNSTSDFHITPPGGGTPAAALFIFDSITGHISAWHGASGAAAQTVVSMPGHVWTGRGQTHHAKDHHQSSEQGPHGRPW